MRKRYGFFVTYGRITLEHSQLVREITNTASWKAIYRICWNFSLYIFLQLKSPVFLVPTECETSLKTVARVQSCDEASYTYTLAVTPADHTDQGWFWRYNNHPLWTHYPQRPTIMSFPIFSLSKRNMLVLNLEVLRTHGCDPADYPLHRTLFLFTH